MEPECRDKNRLEAAASQSRLHRPRKKKKKKKLKLEQVEYVGSAKTRQS